MYEIDSTFPAHMFSRINLHRVVCVVYLFYCVPGDPEHWCLAFNVDYVLVRSSDTDNGGEPHQPIWQEQEGICCIILAAMVGHGVRCPSDSHCEIR